ncbi:hypothetical protein SAMN05216229_12335 [Geopseudomonas sagittaria]|uniref:Uncharacterized protein n=1 Tax=Geopseudomonas sagittaria TaxID=1135990 RepID=A0A1I5YQC7_9GAMM|nr:hypothetical protein [Pseudomonas sagittaria]SFQ46342.1 hypothetical protein SAMN05216229_12335 [Pseudomonas sagittaria]
MNAGQYTRDPAQQAAITQRQAAGYVITKDAPSKVEMRMGGQIIVILRDGSVRRGMRHG